MKNKWPYHTLILLTGVPIFLLCFSSCEKCEDCTKSKFNVKERAMLYDGKDKIQFTNGIDTVSVQIERVLFESDNTDCASWPVSPNCLDYGWAQLNGNTWPLLMVQKISMTKTNDTWQCNKFQIGDSNGFLLNCNEHYELSNNSYDIHTISNYMFNLANIGNVQEIVKLQTIGNISELIRGVYHPEFGVMELTFTNDTWKQIP